MAALIAHKIQISLKLLLYLSAQGDGDQPDHLVQCHAS